MRSDEETSTTAFLCGLRSALPLEVGCLGGKKSVQTTFSPTHFLPAQLHVACFITRWWWCGGNLILQCSKERRCEPAGEFYRQKLGT